MKKVALLLSLALIMALAAIPASAAVDSKVNLSGWITAQMMYAKNPDDPDAGYRFIGNVSQLRVQLTLDNQTKGTNPSVQFSIGTVANRNETNNQNTSNWNWGSDAFNNANLAMNLRITNAVATFNGAFWKNGPEVTMQVGNLTRRINNWVAGERDGGPAGTSDPAGDGVSITKIPVGPFTGSFDYLFVGAGDRLALTQLKGNLDVVDTSLTVASHYDMSTPDHKLVNDIHVGLGADLADGVSIGANYSTDGLNNGYVWDVTGELSTIPGVDITVGARGIDADANWNPRFARRDDDHADCKDNANLLCAHDSRNGYDIGISTTQGGVKLGFDYGVSDSAANLVDDPMTTTKVSASTKVSDFDLSGSITLTDKVAPADDARKVEVSVARKFNTINTKYTLSHEKKDPTNAAVDPTIVHTVTADTTINTPFADGVKIEGQYKTDSSQLNGNPQIHVSATWKAPNGLNLGAHYANYNRNNHGPIPNSGQPDTPKPMKAEGFYLTADYSVNF